MRRTSLSVAEDQLRPRVSGTATGSVLIVTMPPATFEALRISSAEALAASKLSSTRLDALVAGNATRSSDAAWAAAAAVLAGMIALATLVPGTAWLLVFAVGGGLAAMILQAEDPELWACGLGLVVPQRPGASSRVEALTDSLATVAEARLIWERELASVRPAP